jgi:hypothetical protein
VKRTTKQGMRNNVKHAAKLLDYHNRKATEAAKRGLIRVSLREGRTLHHDVNGRHGAGKVILRAAPPPPVVPVTWNPQVGDRALFGETGVFITDIVGELCTVLTDELIVRR